MKITKEYLTKLIKEELNNLLENPMQTAGMKTFSYSGYRSGTTKPIVFKILSGDPLPAIRDMLGSSLPPESKVRVNENPKDKTFTIVFLSDEDSREEKELAISNVTSQFVERKRIIGT